MDTTELKRLFEEWQDMRPTTELVGEPGWQRQITYNPSRGIPTDLFSAYLSTLGIDSCPACKQETLVIPSEINNFAMQYVTDISSTIDPSLSDIAYAEDGGKLRRESYHYATDCLNCGHRMLLRKEFVEKKIEELVGQDSADEHK